MRFSYLILLIISFCFGCSKDKADSIAVQGPVLFELLEPEELGVDFQNVVEDQEDFNVLTYRNYYNGGGVAIGDVNGDGLSDLYFTANMSSNHLYLNEGGLKFKNITESAGVAGQMAWSTGVTMADVNGDGLLDIYVCNSGDVDGEKKKNELFINQGNLQFTESASEYGLDDDGYSTHASFFDFDRDGDLDMYLVNNSFKDPSRIDFTNVRNERNDEGGDKLFENRDGSFVDVSAEAGIFGSKIGFGLGVSVSDVTNDGWPDIYISNDFWERDYLYINQKDGTFTEELTERIPMTSTASMGADIADIDNNGTYEIFSTDMLPATNERLKRTTIFNNYNLEDLRYRNDYHFQYTQNCLQLNNGNGHFKEIANFLGVAATDWSWGALMFDFDNDGWKDIFVSNGVYHDITDMDFSDFIEDQDAVADIVKEKGRFDFQDFLEYLPSNKLSNYAFANKGQLEFENSAMQLGLGMPSFSNGSAYGDLDNDGDLELVLNNVNMTAHIYENKSESLNENAFLKVRLSDNSKNSYGIGAQINITSGTQKFSYQNFQSRGFQSSTEPILTIGLGEIEKIDEVQILWPTGECESWRDLIPNSSVELVKGQGSKCGSLSSTIEIAYLKNVTERLDPSSQHRENLFNDFNYENLMPHMVSSEGPNIVVGDFNGDTLEDYILLGASDDPDKLFIQNQNGSFNHVNQEAFIKDQKFESTCALLIDVDRDADLDVIIGSGGNDPAFSYEDYVLRVYLNDGQGRFTSTSLPGMQALGNFSVIREIELTDAVRGIFIGGRIVPGNYGLLPRNFLFAEAPDGSWRDITSQEVGQTGMVTDAEVADIDGDGDDDMIIVGEWVSIGVFRNDNGTLKLAGTVPNSGGLWQSIHASDINNDGNIDFVLGNWGLNSKFQASSDRPLSLYVNDFDNNKKSECIIEWYAPEDDSPGLFASKNDLTGQLPSLKKTILKNEDYSKKGLKDIFSSDQLDKALKQRVTNLESSILWGRGDFRFDLLPLPREAQYAPVFSIISLDVNGDNFEDLILGGNIYGLKPEVGRMDSSSGLIFINDRNDGFRYEPGSSDLKIKGEIRSIAEIELADDSKGVLVGVNNRLTQLFQYSIK